jgi:hypothetical protein
MERYKEKFCKSRDLGCKMWSANYVYYRLKEGIFVDIADLWISGRKICSLSLHLLQREISPAKNNH